MLTLILLGCPPVFSQEATNKENMGSFINTVYDEGTPRISPDGKILYFFRDGAPDNIGDSADHQSTDIWYSTLGPGGIWSRAVNIGPPLNNASQNFIASVTPDGNSLLLGNVYCPDGSMRKGVSLSHKLVPGEWSFPDPLKIAGFRNFARNASYYLCNDAKTLLLAIQPIEPDNPGMSVTRDLFVSFLKANSWTKPKSLGRILNTVKDECSPFLASDGATLYFSSDGHGGYGGNDLFVSRRLDDKWTSWSEPVNLGPKINTPDWDAQYSVSAHGDYAYFVSYSGSYWKGDIFRIRLPGSVKPRPVVLVSGRVLNAKTGEPMAANIRYELLPAGEDAGHALANSNTGYKITLVSGAIYGFRAEANGFIPVSDHLDTTRVTQYQEITRDLQLKPVEAGQVVRLNNIFFGHDQDILEPESFPELDRIVLFLADNPGILIRVAGHTDNLGDPTYNIDLSRKRASRVLDYIVRKGVDRKRLSSQGYGDSRPQGDNGTDEGRALNRRVEFLILKK